jgi:perosamine synthetase
MKNRALDKFTENVVDALVKVIGSEDSPLHAPSFGEKESQYLDECLRTTYVSSAGPFVDRFEKELAEFTGSKYAISVVNGTAALHLALRIAGVQAGHEVLIPALTFIATANAVTYCNATPHFIDSCFDNLGIDVSRLDKYLSSVTKLESGKCVNKLTGNVISAIVPMHTFGHPSLIDELVTIAEKYSLIVIEDAAESIGSYYKDKHTGSFGKMGVFSFNGNKTITTGGGGAIITDDLNLATAAKYLSTTAKERHDWEFIHNEIGYNYRMPNLNAALGCAQLSGLPEKLKLKRRLFSKYKESFSGISGVKVFEEPSNCISNYWLQTLVLDPDHVDFQEAILRETNQRGIMTRPAWNLICDLPPYKKSPRMEMITSPKLRNSIINIPSSPKLGF